MLLPMIRRLASRWASLAVAWAALFLCQGCGNSSEASAADASSRDGLDAGAPSDSAVRADAHWLGDGPPPSDGSAAPPVYTLGTIPTATLPLPAPGIVPKAQTFFSLGGPPLPAKMAFAHYMVCCGFAGPNGGIGAAEEEIIMAQTMGLNGFALNAGAWLDASNGPAYRARVAEMFAAAKALGSGFVLFFSADMTGLGYADIVAMMSAYGNDPSYFKYDGRPVLSTFGGGSNTDSSYTTPSSWWTNRVLAPLAAQGIHCFFVPDLGFVGGWFDDTSPAFVTQYVNATVANWSPLVQGLLTWETLSVVNNQAGNSIAVPLIDAYQKALVNDGKIYMPLMITKYWGSRQPSNGNIYYEWQGGAGMDVQWRGAIAADVPWVEIGTWNDFGESYMMPMDDFELHNDWGMATGWTKPSFGYAELLRYYVAWFRTGVMPTITKDAVFWFYRTHPAAAVASPGDSGVPGATWSSGAAPGPVSRYVPSADGTGHVPANADQMFISVFATAPAALVVTATTEQVAAGANQFTLPFVAGPAPTFELSRGGASVVSGVGADAIVSTPPYYDWWSSTGFMEK